jgi:hypothetical protein
MSEFPGDSDVRAAGTVGEFGITADVTYPDATAARTMGQFAQCTAGLCLVSQKVVNAVFTALPKVSNLPGHKSPTAAPARPNTSEAATRKPSWWETSGRAM